MTSSHGGSEHTEPEELQEGVLFTISGGNEDDGPVIGTAFDRLPDTYFKDVFGAGPGYKPPEGLDELTEGMIIDIMRALRVRRIVGGVIEQDGLTEEEWCWEVSFVAHGRGNIVLGPKRREGLKRCCVRHQVFSRVMQVAEGTHWGYGRLRVRWRDPKRSSRRHTENFPLRFTFEPRTSGLICPSVRQIWFYWSDREGEFVFRNVVRGDRKVD